MSCEQYKEMMLDSILGEQDINENARLLQHISECKDCRLEYDRICAAVDVIKPQEDENLSPIEKLKLENAIYKARLSRLSASRSYTNVFFKRIAAVAAAFLFMFVGFSIRQFYQERVDLKGREMAEERIGDVIRQQDYLSYGQRMSPQGLLLIAKGKKALEQFK